MTVTEFPRLAKLLVSEAEAAEMLSVSERTLYAMRQDGQIPFVMMRSRVMYRVTALDQWLRDREQGAQS